MPRRDVFHNRVRHALIKDGWAITHDPYLLEFGEHRLFVDLGAEAPIAAEKAGRKIAVEIKGFTGVSEMVELERALGQFMLYHFLLTREEPERMLFLAVPEDTYAALLDTAPGRDLVATYRLRLLTYDPANEVITRWIEP